MNERFERIHKDWMNANMSENGFIDTSKLAHHFYNLALEDVRKALDDLACQEHATFIDRIIESIDQLSK